MEAQTFLDDLEKAKALSLETLELDRLRREKLVKQEVQYSACVTQHNTSSQAAQNVTTANHQTAKNHCSRGSSSTSLNCRNKTRRRPSCKQATTAEVTLLPPPRRSSMTPAITTATEIEDLIVLSPLDQTEKKTPLEELEDTIGKLDVTSAVSTTATSHNRIFDFSSSAISTTLFSSSVAGLSSYSFMGPFNTRIDQTTVPVFSPPPVVSRNLSFPSTPVLAINQHAPTPALVGGSLAAFLPSTDGVRSSVLDPSLGVLKFIEKKRNSNLIDLGGDDLSDVGKGVVVANVEDVLRTFDPLLVVPEDNGRPPPDTTVRSTTDVKVDSGFEDNFDPSPLLKCQQVEMSADVQSKSPSPPPLPPRPSTMCVGDGVNVSLRPKSTALRSSLYRCGQVFDLYSNGRPCSLTNHPPAKRTEQRRQSRHYECIRVVRGKLEPKSEIEAFRCTVVNLRSEFLYNDYHTNVGLVISPTLESLREESTSVKLVINSSLSDKPILFTCDVTTTVEHIISHVVCTLYDDISDIDFKKFVLKVYGLAEYFSADSSLVDYEYVHFCQKYDEDVQLTLVKTEDLKRPLARTVQDDNNDMEIKIVDLLPPESQNSIPFETISILLETFEREVEKMREQALKTNGEVLQSLGVVQAVKAICAILSQVEISDITKAVEGLAQITQQFSRGKADKDIVTAFKLSEEQMMDDTDVLTIVELAGRFPNTGNTRMDLLQSALERLNQAIRDLLDMYCHCFHVDFHVPNDYVSARRCIKTKEISSVVDTVVVHVATVHRLPMWSASYDSYHIVCDLHHGTNACGEAIVTKQAKVTANFHEQILFDELIVFPSGLLCTLPREARLVFTLFGNKVITVESSKTTDVNQTQSVALGWVSVQLFNYDGSLKQGNYLYGLWPDDESKTYGSDISNVDFHCPILQINLPDFGCSLTFPSVVRDYPCQRRDFEGLDIACQQDLLNIIERPSSLMCSVEDREFLWERRHYLYEIPQALPKVLLAAHSWDWACLADIYSMLREWKPLSPVDALELLLPWFPDIEVRKTAINWVKNLGSDELCDYLPQLVQALKYETWDDSPTAKFLLERSLTSIRVAHHLYWLLKQNLDDPRCHRRIQLMLNAMLLISGRAMRARFHKQEELMNSLATISNKIKTVKDSIRLNTLFQELESIHYMLTDTLTSLPLSPSIEVTGLDVKASSYFTSNTLPLKLNFKSTEIATKPFEAIFKVGDDLRQDMLTLQMIRIMDKLWLKEGLDLRIVTFRCVPTGFKEGIVEMVTGAETLRKIQTEHGLTGSFKDRPIAEWLQKHNPSELEYQQAVENFTYSCAGYSVATYILGICDRHNDNIMLKTSGHLFHIDFGKFLGDAQMFGSIKRDRVPFVLTSDMAYVINGGDKPSSKFQHFVEQCCHAFNIIRKHGNLFLNLFALMTAAGIPGVTSEAVSFVQKALLPEMSETEATAYFARMIEDSLKSWFTQFNFFIHNLAQLRFTGDHNDGTLLSFIPKTYTIETDGRIRKIVVTGYQKRYEPEKYYVYIIHVERDCQPDPSILFRSYREFCELQQKLCTRFPLAKYRYHSLPRSVPLGRSNIRQVAEKRKAEIESFLGSIWHTADEIRHCDLIYTFFHPLLRDQQEGIAHLQKVKAEPSCTRPISAGLINGQVKLSLRFHENTLFIMVMHAKNLVSFKNADPDPYVKTYLIPDPNKVTKRKTKVIRKNSHPTFMEMLHYKYPLELIRQKELQVSVWNHDRMAENTFLGAVNISLANIDLSKETIQWYSLGNLYL